MRNSVRAITSCSARRRESTAATANHSAQANPTAHSAARVPAGDFLIEDPNVALDAAADAHRGAGDLEPAALVGTLDYKQPHLARQPDLRS